MDIDPRTSASLGHRPRFDYAEWSNTDLVVRLILLRSRGRICASRVLALGEWQDWKARFRCARRIVDNPNPAALAALYRLWPHPEPFRYLLWVRSECEHIAVELRKRLEGFRVGRALLETLGAEPPPDAVLRLKQALGVAQMEVIRPYQHEEDPDDLHQVAVAHALGRYRKLTEGIQVKQEVTDEELRELCSPPDFGIPDPGEDLGDIGLRFVVVECREALERFGPIFDGDVESTRGYAHQALRDHFQERKARKREGRRVPINRVPLAAATRSEPEMQTTIETAYRFVLGRWGDRGARFLAARLDGETLTAAAKVAGVSRQTGDKYMKELRRHLSTAR